MSSVRMPSSVVSRPEENDFPWPRHTIDPADKAAGKLGADGVRLGDFNDDGLLDMSDAIRLLSFLFLGGPPPPAPTECGFQPDPLSTLSCDDSDCDPFNIPDPPDPPPGG